MSHRSPWSPTDTLAFSSTQLSCHEPTLPLPSLPFSNFLTFLVGKMDATPNTNLIPDYNDLRHVINRNQDSRNINYLMVNQNRDDLYDPANSLVSGNLNQEDFGQVNRKRLWSGRMTKRRSSIQNGSLCDSGFLLRRAD